MLNLSIFINPSTPVNTHEAHMYIQPLLDTTIRKTLHEAWAMDGTSLEYVSSAYLFVI